MLYCRLPFDKIKYNLPVSEAFSKFFYAVDNSSLFFSTMAWKQEEMFTFQIILARLPLPEQTFMGYWTIGQSRNGIQKLLCPTETHHIDIKVDTIISLLKCWMLQIFLYFPWKETHTISEMTCFEVILGLASAPTLRAIWPLRLIINNTQCM